MPAGKTTNTTAAPDSDAAPLIARYIPIAAAAMLDRVIERDQTGATKVEMEIEEQLRLRFRGEALTTMLALVAWIRQLGVDLAGPSVEELAAASGFEVHTVDTKEQGGLITNGHG